MTNVKRRVEISVDHIKCFEKTLTKNFVSRCCKNAKLQSLQKALFKVVLKIRIFDSKKNSIFKTHQNISLKMNLKVPKVPLKVP